MAIDPTTDPTIDPTIDPATDFTTALPTNHPTEGATDLPTEGVSRDRVARRLPGKAAPWRVFLSHTSELRQFPSNGGSYIDKAERAVSAAGHVVGNMEHYRAGDGNTGRFDQQQVQEADVYVGIYGMRWGTPVPDQPDLSYTVQEFEAASAAAIPRLIFVVDENDDGEVRIPVGYLRDDEHGHRQQAFLKRIHTSGELIIKRFRGPDHLAGLVENSLRELEKQQGLGVQAGAAAPARPSYTVAALDAWVATHQVRLGAAFAALPSVRDRRVHVPLEVKLSLATAADEPIRLLEPADLAPLLERGGNHVLLISGDGGAGKTSQAYAIARWWLQGEPGGVVRIPVLIETALAAGETVVARLQQWLRGQLAGSPPGDLEPELVEALLEAKRLIPIVDHLSELTPSAREQLLAALPPGLVLVTSRSDDDGFRERPLSRIVPQGIGLNRLPDFFLDYLHGKNIRNRFTPDDLAPAQAQLRRIVGSKSITVLLAQLFINDVIDNLEEGFLAGSVPELMLRYVRKLDTPADPAMRQRAGLLIDEGVVQQALRVVALAGHRQAPSGLPLFQPLEFSNTQAVEALKAPKPAGLALPTEQAEAVLAYLIELRLLQPRATAGRLRFPLDPLADYLAAAEQLEQLEALALTRGPAEWEAFVAALEPRPQADRERMRGFLLALRDGVMEAQGRRALAMPAWVPDKLADLGLLNPEDERYRLALQRARKWMWELGVPVALERRDGIAKLAAMAAAPELNERKAARDVASRRLARLLEEAHSDLERERREEQQEAAVVLGLMGSPEALEALSRTATDPAQPPLLRRTALEALGLAARALTGEAGAMCRSDIEDVLLKQLEADTLNLLVESEEGWAEHDRRLPLLQGASRGLQLEASAGLPLLGSGPGRRVPMLTLTALQEGEALRIRTEVVKPELWRLPLPSGEQLEIVVVHGGDYDIGSPETEESRDWYASSREACRDVNVEAERRVQVEGFAMVRHLITQAQWRAVAELPQVKRELNPSPGTDAKGLWETHAQPGALPVDSVSWNDCQEWLRRLNRWLQSEWQREGGHGASPQLTLPGEGQWEVACRAGASTPFHFGHTLDASWANYDAGYTYGPGRKGLYRQRPVSAGFFGLVNRWGMADLHGQLYEWCGDQWHPNPMDEGWPADGRPWNTLDPRLAGLDTAQKHWKLLRGGSWFNNPHNARTAFRSSHDPDYDNTNIGLRPCCPLPPGSLLGS